MNNLKIISSEQYNRFMDSCDQGSFTQLEKWGAFKQSTNWEQELLGYQKDGVLIGVAQVLYKGIPRTGYKIAYSSGGYSLISDCFEPEFNRAIFKYLKMKKCILYKIDPQCELEKQSCHNFEAISSKQSLDVSNLQLLGYKHLGYYNQFEGMQPRHTIRIDTSNGYPQVLDSMSSNTKRNIKTATKYQSVTIIDCQVEQLPEFYQLLTETAKRDQFSIRDFEYFKKLLKTLEAEVTLTMACVDLDQLTCELTQVASRVDSQIEKLLTKDNYSVKQLKNLEAQQVVNQERIREVSELRASRGQFVYLAANLSITDGKRAWYLYGASSSSLKFLRSVYLLMNDRIVDCIANQYQFYDLYGVSGIFDTSHPDYGLYQFKSGFGGELIEYIGEFDKPLNIPIYILFNKIYPRLKQVRKSRARANTGL